MHDQQLLLKHHQSKQEHCIAGPVWTTLYILCGVSSWLVWTHGGFEKQRVPLTLYGINMLFNLAWNPTFFLFHAMQTAFWDALGMPSGGAASCPWQHSTQLLWSCHFRGLCMGKGPDYTEQLKKLLIPGNVKLLPILAETLQAGFPHGLCLCARLSYLELQSSDVFILLSGCPHLRCGDDITLTVCSLGPQKVL